MAAVIKGHTGQKTYEIAVRHVLDRGVKRQPRGLATRDAGCVIIELDTPHRALPLGCGRELNKNIAAAEAAQLIGAFSEPRLLTSASPKFYAFMDGDQFHGAYGSRIGQQMHDVIRKLKDDPNTRQAVVTLWDPYLDNSSGWMDYPCTVMLQFEIRNGRLCMTTVMRSNDAWLGLPYDLFQFTQLQLTLNNALDMNDPPGMYRHIALSLHIYERDIISATKLHDATDFTEQPIGFGTKGERFDQIQKQVRAVVDGTADSYTSSEKWYRERFASYLG